MNTFISCKKESNNATAKEAEIFKTSTEWLKVQAGKSTPEGNTRILELLNKLNKKEVSFTSESSGSLFCAVKVDEPSERDLQQKYLVLKLNKEGKVDWTVVVTYETNDRAYVPSQRMAALMQMNQVTDGNYSLYSLTGNFVNQIEYSKGQINKTKSLRKIPVNKKEKARVQDYCYEWYLVTTYYYPDGTYTESREYLGTTCTNCPPNSVCEPQMDDGAGGNATEVVKQVNWVVGAANNWLVKAYTELKGIKAPDIPGGGFFTNVRHLNSAIFNLVQEPIQWTELAVTNQAEGWIGKSHVTGKITTTDLPEFQISRQNVWGFGVEFP